MKILFLCGSLEPGQDGVGDYTRRLSAEIIRRGNQVSIIALNDRKITEIVTESQISEETAIDVLRMPNHISTRLRFQKAQNFITTFNPEWISLQYVPFSFHKKGLPFGLTSNLLKIGKDRKWHIMFHELWVGMNSEASLKLKIRGFVQKKMIHKFIKKIKPSVVHTQSQLYHWQLNKLGIENEILPLFSNIKAIDFKSKSNDLNKLSFVVFGTIHPEAPIVAFAHILAKYALRNNLDIEMIFIGRCGNEQDRWITVCQSEKIKINILGEQTSLKISEVLFKADFGITSTPFLLSEKSGTVAAMKEHGLPILCISKSWKVKDYSLQYFPENIELFDDKKDFTYYLKLKSEKKIRIIVSEVLNQFLDSLN